MLPKQPNYSAEIYMRLPRDDERAKESFSCELEDDLNSNASGSDLHIFYTRDTSFSTAVSEITIDNLAAGTVSGMNLNASAFSRAWDGSKNATPVELVYMHLSTKQIVTSPTETTTTTTTTPTITPSENVRTSDINDDDSIDLKDIFIMRRALVGDWDIPISEAADDVNHGGSFDLKDVMILRRFIAGGWEIIL